MTSRKVPNRKRSSSPRQRKNRKRNHGFREPGRKKFAVWVFIGATALIVIAAVLYEIQTQRDEAKFAKNEQKNDSTQPVTTDELTAIKLEYARLSASTAESVPVQIVNLEKKIRLAKQAMELADTPEDTNWSKLAFLSAAAAMESTRVGNQFPQSANFESFKELVAEWENSSDERIAKESTVTSLFLKIIDTLRSDDLETSSADTTAKLDQVLQRYPESLDVAKSFPPLFLGFRIEKKFEPLEIALKLKVGEHYAKCKQPELIRIGQGYITDALLLKYGIPAKEKAFIVNRFSAAQELATAVQELIANETISRYTLVRLVGSCNVMESHGHYLLAVETANKLIKVADQLPISEVESFRKAVARTITRCRAIGSPIKISEKAADGTPINSDDLPSKPFLVFFLPGKSKQLDRLFGVARNIETTYQDNVKVIMIAVEGSKEELLATAKLNNVESELIIDTDMSTELFQQFPVENLPSLLIVDGDRVMKKMIIGIADLNDAMLKLFQGKSE